jgi:hypothetical protein
MRAPQLYLAVAVALAACEHDVTIDTPTITKRISEGNNLDLLFVIDNSASTFDKQTLFAQNFPALAATLDEFPSGRPNLHIGVVSTSVDLGHDANVLSRDCPSPSPDDGRLQITPRVAGCMAPHQNYIIDAVQPDGSRLVNYAGTLPDELSCIALLGATGCGFEAPLEAMKRALDGSNPENAGFLRDGADLAVIILTDEDDCSGDASLFQRDTDVGPGDFRCQPLLAYDCDTAISSTDPGTYTNCKVRHGGPLRDPSAYTQFLSTIRDPSQTVVAVIGGDPTSTITTGPIVMPIMQSLTLQPSCSATINGNSAIGRPALRLDELVEQFGDHGIFESVCEPDYTPALVQIGKTLFTMMSPCIEGDIAIADIAAANPGLQPACTVTEDGLAMPACPMADPLTPAAGGARPCWWMDVDSATCASTPTGLLLHIEHDRSPSPGGILAVTCAGA